MNSTNGDGGFQKLFEWHWVMWWCSRKLYNHLSKYVKRGIKTTRSKGSCEWTIAFYWLSHAEAVRQVGDLWVVWVWCKRVHWFVYVSLAVELLFGLMRIRLARQFSIAMTKPTHTSVDKAVTWVEEPYKWERGHRKPAWYTFGVWWFNDNLYLK